jgi:hypothetical protein
MGILPLSLEPWCGQNFKGIQQGSRSTVPRRLVFSRIFGVQRTYDVGLSHSAEDREVERASCYARPKKSICVYRIIGKMTVK